MTMASNDSARRPSAPGTASVLAVRPRANSEPTAAYGSCGHPSKRGPAHARHRSEVVLNEKQWLLHNAFSATPAIAEEKDVARDECFPSSACEKAGDSIITSPGMLQSLADLHPLPPQLGTEVARHIWGFLSMYRLIFAFALVANLLAVVLAPSFSIVTYSDAATAAAINLCVAVLVRNEHTINVFFRLACFFGPSTPLSARRVAAKVYSYGGLHSGCATAGTLWYFAFCFLLGYAYTGPYQSVLVSLAITVSVLLWSVACVAFPSFRITHHNIFENVHRLAGWTAILILWAQLAVSCASQSLLTGKHFGILVAQAPLFWCLIIITITIIYPWTRLRSRSVNVQVLSPNAAMLHFDYKRMSTCLGVRLTDSPSKETHSFATISKAGDEIGFRVLMSRAGDWTSKIIDNPPTKIWVKGAPVFGVMRVALMFRKVLVVATGTGIGPCLSLLESCPEHPMHVLWMGSNPRASYGDAIVNSVYFADPSACIVDTSQAGRGDILALAHSRYLESKSEAVVIISNAKVTRVVVEGLESRGIPVYGAIFDS